MVIARYSEYIHKITNSAFYSLQNLRLVLANLSNLTLAEYSFCGKFSMSDVSNQYQGNKQEKAR
jgi:hypothetical protein